MLRCLTAENIGDIYLQNDFSECLVEAITCYVASTITSVTTGASGSPLCLPIRVSTAA